jgi:hypothetical protein
MIFYFCHHNIKRAEHLMTNYSPLFGTGLARSGGGFYSLCLSTNSEIMLACCPNIELFRHFRNSVIQNQKDEHISREIPTHSPLQDFYGSDVRIRALDAMMNASLNIPFDMNNWNDFLKTSVLRGTLEAEDLVKYYERLKASNYRDIFKNLLNIIATARNSLNRKWVGFHETWTLDAYPALARAFPDAKFIVMFRDPRAIINSMRGIEAIDPLQGAHILSYVRHWRKYVALALRYRNDPLFKDRLHITSHDLILTKPKETISAICKTLCVDFNNNMLNTDDYIDFSTGETWVGNSSFENETSGIKASRARRWRDNIEPTVLDTIEYLCGPDLELAGYTPVTRFSNPNEVISNSIFEYLLNEHDSYSNWRSDMNDPLANIGMEAVRRSLLTSPISCPNKPLIRKLFLFTETYKYLRSKDTNPLLSGLHVYNTRVV